MRRGEIISSGCPFNDDVDVLMRQVPLTPLNLVREVPVWTTPAKRKENAERASKTEELMNLTMGCSWSPLTQEKSVMNPPEK